MNNIDLNELDLVIKSSKLKFNKNELENIINDMKVFMNIVNQINDFNSENNHYVNHNINFSKLREDIIKKDINMNELFQNINHELYNNGIIIPKLFE